VYISEWFASSYSISIVNLSHQFVPCYNMGLNAAIQNMFSVFVVSCTNTAWLCFILPCGVVGLMLIFVPIIFVMQTSKLLGG